MTKSLLQRVEDANKTRRETGDSDNAVVNRVSSETGIPLNPRSGEDVQTARNIEKAKQASAPTEGKPPVA